MQIFISKLFYFAINIFFFSKKIFSKPKLKKILIINGDKSDLIKCYFKKKELDVVYNRFTRGIERDAEINIYIILLNIIKLKFSILEYAKAYIEYSKPKLIITIVDNDIFFYELKKYFPNIKFIAIQNSLRSTQEDIFGRINELKKKKFSCDYILVFNYHFGNYYEKFIKSKIVQIGSFTSNQIKINKLSTKYDILFVSSYKGQKDDEIFSKAFNISWADVRKQDERILSYLKKIKMEYPYLGINILGCKNRTNELEKKYFDKHLSGIKYNFIPQKKGRKTYSIIDRTNLMIAIDSSLIYESLSRGNKVCIFGNRGKKYPLNSSRFAWPAKINTDGFFWSSQNDFKTFRKIILRNYKISKQNFFKKYKKTFYTSLSIYDYKNIVFKKIIKKLDLFKKND